MAATAAQRAWAGRDIGFFVERGYQVKDSDITEFDRQVAKLKLKPWQLVSNVALRYWAMANANRRYVPEELLSAWAIKVNAENWE